jgi:3-methylcrotonyl-CoA carboxylase alpha subunit
VLPLAQKDIRLDGHAFEARVYAESPRSGFLPHTGHLWHLRPPAESANVRVDTGVRQGDDVSIYYDPMIAKLIVWDRRPRRRAAPPRRGARRLPDRRPAEQHRVFALASPRHPAFVRGQVDTSFIAQYKAKSSCRRSSRRRRQVLAAAALFESLVAPQIRQRRADRRVVAVARRCAMRASTWSACTL